MKTVHNTSVESLCLPFRMSLNHCEVHVVQLAIKHAGAVEAEVYRKGD